MKLSRIFSVIATAVMFASCAQLESDVQMQSEMPSSSAAISFSADVATKGIVNGNTDTYSEGFSVFCKAQNSESSTIPFDNTHIYHKGSNWAYDTPRYWSFSLRYDFIGLYPYKATGYSYNPSDNTVTVNATTGFQAGAQNDYLAGAEHRQVEKSGAAQTAVTFNKMKHLCAAVEFNITNTSSETYTFIKFASLTGIYSNGTCQVVANGKDVNFGWNLTGSKANSGFEGDVTLENFSREDGKKALYSEPMIVLPQDVTGDVEFSAHFKRANGQEVVRTVKVNTGDFSKWEAGKRYVYNIEMKADDITITRIQVEDWVKGFEGSMTYSNK